MSVFANVLDFTNNLIGLWLMLYAASRHPYSQRIAASLWRWCHPRLAAKWTAAKSSHPWRKAFAALALCSFIGGFAASLTTEAMAGTASPWALCWLGNAMAGILLVSALDRWPACRRLMPL